MRTSKHNGGLICLVSVGIALALCGCAGVQPSNLQPVDGRRPLLVNKPFSYDAYYRVTGIRWRWTLAPGQYAAQRQDQTGVYYLGPSQCLSQTLLEAGWGERPSMIGKTVGSYGCGIYVPHDSTQEPSVFLLVGTWQSYPDGRAPVPQDVLPDAVVTSAIVGSSVYNATPLQVEMGGAIGAAVVGVLVVAEQGNYAVHRDQPIGADLRLAFSPPRTATPGPEDQ